MTNNRFKSVASKLALTFILLLPALADAQYFNFNSIGDVLAGFRKTGGNAGKYELVVDLGSVTNFLAQPAGTTVTITNFSPSQLTDAFQDTGGFQNLQWSVFSSFYGISGAWVTPVGSFPKSTVWYTVPSPNVSVQTTPPARNYSSESGQLRTLIDGVGSGAATVSGYLGVTNTDNNSLLVRESVANYPQNILSAYIGDASNPTLGDFGANNNALPYAVENTTPNPFTGTQRDDFYQFVPNGSVDPVTGQTSGNADYIGYFLLYANGTETFTRASAATAPVIIAVAATATNGFSPLQVVFTNNTSGSITNWVWNFGNGNIITNTSGAAVTNVYTTAGDYSVTLAVFGPAGATTNLLANYVISSPAPSLGQASYANGSFVFGGNNGPAGVEYRILESTNLANWFPVFTNTIPSNGTYSYTNSTGQAAAYFRLVSP